MNDVPIDFGLCYKQFAIYFQSKERKRIENKNGDCVEAIQSLANCVTNAKQRKMAAIRKRNNAM